MTSKSHSHFASLARFNKIFAKVLLALWPQENRPWGVAFASESAAIDSPQQQFRWLLGGISVLAREYCNSFLKSLFRPVGVGPHVPQEPLPEGPSRSPRTPRLVLAFLFLIFIWLFWQPQTRAVFRSVSQAYSEAGWYASRWSEVQRIQILAEQSLTRKNRDPQLLAFASLLYPEESKRLSLADSAVQADPSLAWIDYQNAVLPWNDITKQHSLPADRIDRMLAADPDNAALFLLRAESIALLYRHKDAQADPNALHIATWGALATRDTRWLAAMNAAFSASRYDPYDEKLFRLSRDVIERYSVNDPRILSSVLGHRPLDQYLAILAYTKALLSQASAARHSGDIHSAINDCRVILDFARRLRAGNFFKLETWTANSIESQTYPLLQSLYESSGRASEALEVAVRVQGNRAERTEFSSAFGHLTEKSFAHWSRSEWAALLIQTSVLAIWILLPLSLASIVLLWMFRRYSPITNGALHSLLCLFSDLCPSFLVLACAILFTVYAPYDQTYHQILRSPFSSASYQEFGQAAYAPFALPSSVQIALGSLFGPYGRFLLWSALSAVLLSLVAVFIHRQLPGRGSAAR